VKGCYAFGQTWKSKGKEVHSRKFSFVNYNNRFVLPRPKLEAAQQLTSR
jgi:hypothetical protein